MSPKGRIREKLWVPYTMTPFGLAAGAMTSADILTNAAEDIRRDATVLRIRGEIALLPNATWAHLSANWIYAGITVIDRDQLGGTLPDPETDYADFMWYSSYYHFGGIHFVWNGSSVSANLMADPRYIPLDNRSMRKLLGQRQTLAFIVKADASNAAQLSVGLAIRSLVGV